MNESISSEELIARTNPELTSGERQVAPTLSGIRRDHTARYQWAVEWLGDERRKILDFACGVGYGSKMLADAGHSVIAMDRSRDAVEYARIYYGRSQGIKYHVGDETELSSVMEDSFGAVVCFETLEHLERPLPVLREFCRAAPVLIVSVPNQRVFPWHKGIAFHHVHYKPEQLYLLLEEAGYVVEDWFSQEGPESDVLHPYQDGRTMIAVARRRENEDDRSVPPPQITRPRHLVILGLGPSLELYIDTVKRMGGRRAFSDEVWTVNALGDIVHSDRVFHMDDMRVQELRALMLPNSNISEMVDWMRCHPGPVYTSRVYDRYPGMVEFPLEEIINSLGEVYFNSTVAYAMALAIHEGFQEITLFGCDFTYPGAHKAEQGRACLEFWIGMAKARGIKIGVPENTSLLDTYGGNRLYGYDTRDVTVTMGDDGMATVEYTEKDPPTAEEIERRYDHAAHPNSIVREHISKEQEE